MFLFKKAQIPVNLIALSYHRLCEILEKNVEYREVKTGVEGRTVIECIKEPTATFNVGVVFKMYRITNYTSKTVYKYTLFY